MARFPDGFIFVVNTKLKSEDGKVAVDVSLDEKELVMCRNCIHAHMTSRGECKYCEFWQDDGGDPLYLDGDFFCAAGERRDEE